MGRGLDCSRGNFETVWVWGGDYEKMKGLIYSHEVENFRANVAYFYLYGVLRIAQSDSLIPYKDQRFRLPSGFS